MAIKPSQLKAVRQRNYLGKDFDGLRKNLLDYARLYYPNKISDFSENSLGGLFLELAAYVGDNLSFYLDHQFNELDPETTIETQNLQKHIDTAGVTVSGASPALVNCTFLIEVPSKNVSGKIVPDPDLLPVVKAGTIVSSTEGVSFELIDDLDYSLTKENGDYVASQRNGTVISSQVKSFVMSMVGQCISGKLSTKTYSIGTFVPFRRLTLPNLNVSEIIKVYDSFGNVYYEVGDLTEDVVYHAEKNMGSDNKSVTHNLTLKSAPYRYTKSTSISSRLTTLTFGGGNADSFQDDIIPDPTIFAIPLPNNKTFSRTAINPQKLLSTRTLGIASENTTLNVIYRYGGGLTHNVSENTITKVSNASVFFPKNPMQMYAQQVTNSLEVINLEAAEGGEDPPSIDEIKALIPSFKNSQQRIVTKEDMLSRIYTMPSNFGKVFRAAVGTNYNNPYSTTLYIVSRDNEGNLKQSSDNLKINLSRYLNEYRMISDAVDILDAPIINFYVIFSAIIDSKYNSNLVYDAIKEEIKNFFNVSRMQINKPINVSELYEILFAVDGVISLPENPFKFVNLSGAVDNREYSEFSVNMDSLKPQNNGMYFPPEGGIFELKYPEINIRVR